MSSDRPQSDGPVEDSPLPGEAPRPAQPHDSGAASPSAEPTQAFPPFDAAVPAGAAWTSAPGGWAAPEPDQVFRTTPAATSWTPGQPGPHPGAPDFSGQAAPQAPGPYPLGAFGSVPPSGPPPHWTTVPPQPLAGNDWQPPPRQRGLGWLIALVVVSAVVLLSLIVALALPVLTHLPTLSNRPSPVPTRATGQPSATAKPTPTASPDPTSSPRPSMPTAPLDVLKKNPVYGLRVPAKCAYQNTPSSQAAFRKQVRKLIDCQNVAWQKALSRSAVTFDKPSVKFYSSSTQSPCGKLGTGFPASYCTSNSTLYFSSASYQQGRYFRLSVAGFVMHEYAHHVQKLAGIFGATEAMKESTSVTSRRIELQAHCIAHYELTVSGVGYGSLDNRQIEYQWDYTNDPKGHGSAAAERYWGERGLDGKTIGACNTWSVKASRVK